MSLLRFFSRPAAAFAQVAAVVRAKLPVLAAGRFNWWLVAGVVVLNALASSFVLHNLAQNRTQALERVTINSENLARLLEQNIAASSRMVDLALLTIVDEMEAQLSRGKLDDAVINRLLAAHQARLPAVEGFRVTDADGRLRWGKGVSASTQASYADRDYFQMHRLQPESGLIVTRPILGRISQVWTIAFTRAYRRHDGAFAGVVSASMPVAEFAAMLGHLQLGAHGSAVLRADNGGLIAAYPALPGEFGQPGERSLSADLRAALAGGQRRMIFNSLQSVDGIERTYALRRIERVPMLLLIGLAPADYLDNWRHEWRKNWGLLAAFFLLTVLSAVLLSSFWRRRLADADSLLRSEGRFRSYVQDSPFALFVMAAGGRCVDCNPAACELLGYDRDSLLMLSIDAILPAAELDTLAGLGSDGRIDRELRLLCRDGALIWVQLRAVRQDDGHWLGFCQDISQRKNTEEALARHEGLLQQIFDTSSVAIFLVDNRGIITVANRRMAEMYERTMDTLIGSEYVSLIHPDEREAGRTRMLALLASNVDDVDLERHYWRDDGTGFWGRLTGRRFYNEHGEGRGLIGVIDDITQRKVAELALKDSEAYNRVLFSESRMPMVVIDPATGCFVDCNEAAIQIYAYQQREEVIGLSPLSVSAPVQYDGTASAIAAEAHIQECLAQGSVFFNWRHQRPNGDIWDAEVHLMRFEHGDRTLLQFHLYDITEKKLAAELVWRKANFDTLTGLPNRQLFYDRLQLALKQAERAESRVALLFIDLDHFKEINDTLGHDMGDLLLRQAGQRLRMCLRESDTVARLGGDEFTVILNEVDQLADIERVAQHLLKELAQPYPLGSEMAYVSASIGITLYPDDGFAVETLLKNADQAMYAAKDAGRNGFSWFTADMQRGAQQRRMLAQDLRVALAEKQFEVYYQPIIDLGNRTIVKAEALLRWHHPGHGMVSPTQFIPIAEEMGLICEIGDWVFRQAVQMAHHCGERLAAIGAPGIQISVNKSPRQFLNSHTHESWIDYLHQIGLDERFIIIEITEGLLLDERPEIADRLLQFRDLGIQVALDDFGTGYSAMSYLQRFDIDYLKIDQSFVRNMVTSPGDLAIVEAIIAMAHKLGMKTVAEGIETAQQCDLLTAAGCDYGQGYLFSPAVPVARFEELLFQGRVVIAADRSNSASPCA